MDSGRRDDTPGIHNNITLKIETISCWSDGVLCISVKGSGGKRRWFKWKRAQKNADECVWTSDEDDVNSAPGKTKEIGKERGKAWAPDGKKKVKSGKWNRSQKGTIECGWDSDAVSDLTECHTPVEKPRAKKKLKWVSDPKSAHERPYERRWQTETAREGSGGFRSRTRTGEETGQMEQTSERRHGICLGQRYDSRWLRGLFDTA